MRNIYLLFAFALLWGLTPAEAQNTDAQAQPLVKKELIPDTTEKTSAQKKEIEDACKFAETLDLTENDLLHQDYNDNGRIPLPENVKTAIVRLENLIAKYPNHPEVARAYLFLGKLRRKYQNNYYAVKDASDQDAPPPEIAKYADNQYWLHESASTYFYNGWHFDQIIKKFPNSSVIDAAVYEKTFIPYTECDSDENCWVDSKLDPMVDFLNKYPNSSLAPSAIARANKAFDSLMHGWADSKGTPVVFNLESDRTGYSVKTFKDSVIRYENVANKLSPLLKASALDKISEAWGRAGEKAKAISTAEAIVSKFPDYPNINSVKDRLQKLKAPK